MLARKLKVLELNDEQSDAEGLLRGFMEHVRIEDVERATEVLLGANPHEAVVADVFIIDVNFHATTTGEAKKANWGNQPGHDQVIPYGPLLALPFLRTGTPSVWIPFSAHWTPELAKNGYLAVAFSFIAAVTGDERYSLERSIKALGEKREDLVGFARAALSAGVRAYRERLRLLTTTGRSAIVDGDSTHERVRVLAKKDRHRNLPWEIEREEPGLWVRHGLNKPYGQQTNDCIALSSLYADILDFEQNPSTESVDFILSDLHDWLSDPNLESIDLSTAMRERVLLFWKQIRQGGHLTIQDVEDGIVRRHLYNVAWLNAIRMHKDRRTFPEPPPKHPATTVRKLLGLDAGFKLHRLFFPNDNAGIPDPDSKEWWRNPYPENWRDVAREYEETEPAGTVRPLSWFYYLPYDDDGPTVVLDESEIRILDYFAEEVFGWDPREANGPAWPKWLRDV